MRACVSCLYLLRLVLFEFCVMCLYAGVCVLIRRVDIFWLVLSHDDRIRHDHSYT